MKTSQYLFPTFDATVTMQHPDSHILECYGYLQAEKLLFIKIIDNGLYAYENVSPYIFQQMQSAVSKGKFFLREIRDYYQYRRVSVSKYLVLENESAMVTPGIVAMPAIHELSINRPDCWL